MSEEKEEIIRILKEATIAISNQDPVKLQLLSDDAVNMASISQATDTINLAVIMYALSKIMIRKHYSNEKMWLDLIKKISASLSLAITSLREEDYKNFAKHLQKIRQLIESKSSGMTPYIKDIVEKAKINKASKIYEHGISLSQTADLLGITQWELADYIGQKKVDSYESSPDIKKRLKRALNFFQ